MSSNKEEKSKCCNKPLVKSGDRYFCGTTEGCGNWAEPKEEVGCEECQFEQSHSQSCSKYEKGKAFEEEKEEINFMQVGETVACGHCEPEKFGIGLKVAEATIINYKCECKCHDIIKEEKEYCIHTNEGICDTCKSDNAINSLKAEEDNNGWDIGEILADFENDHNEVKAVESIQKLLSHQKQLSYEQGHTDGMELRKDYTEFNQSKYDEAYERGKEDAKIDLDKLQQMTYEQIGYDNGKKETLDKLQKARDDDSCECDNCHRTRKFIRDNLNRK